MTGYDNVAKQYSDSMSDKGDFYHRTQIDPNVYKIIGDPKGKIIYDLGCGNGYIARNLVKKGAKVFASDVSSELVKLAKEKSKGLEINYSVRDALDFTGFADGQFDIVIMSMVIHYIKNVDALFRGISRILREDGLFVLSTSHPFSPGRPYSVWEAGKINGKEVLFVKVTGYLKKEARNIVCWCDDKTKLVMYNQPLNLLVNTMAKYGLYIFQIEEPGSDGFAHDFSKELQKSHHIPTFIIIGARKSLDVKIHL